MELRQRVEEYLKECIIMQLATSTNDKPWCCNLHYAYDDQLNLYWMSLQNCRHSKAVATNQNVAVTIARPHTLQDRPQGLQAEGTAGKADDFEGAFRVYMDRYPRWLEKEDELRRGNPDGRAIYKFTPNRIVMFDIVNHPQNPQQELVLKSN